MIAFETQSNSQTEPRPGRQKKLIGLLIPLVAATLTGCGSSAPPKGSETPSVEKFDDSAIQKLARDIFSAGHGREIDSVVTTAGTTNNGDFLHSSEQLKEHGQPASASDVEASAVVSDTQKGITYTQVLLRFVEKGTGWQATCESKTGSVHANSLNRSDWSEINAWANAAQGIVHQAEVSLAENPQLQPAPNAPCGTGD